ncbi:CCA tRNA nucleotidyltransferase [Streptococcus halichoeri]|uniref:CCA tRNA nucleotidyltransferase n=1 Tax=Streptococcus halichoeri TaxID=254785 RepID=UPI0013589AF7|nr:CCA tRNA nucleotidyltransferase [Streptococcus halichoeri]
MKLTTMPSEFQEALPILERIKAAGYEAYFVGGSVRDSLLGRPIHDVDIATSSYPHETKQLFARTVDIGIEHGTVLVLENNHEYEITTFRTEDVYVDYRRPSRVAFIRSLEEDLKRRDFTVNAFALASDGTVIDKFSGIADLKAKKLRAVGKAQERFEEDALRIMRGFRFVATLDFDIEASTYQAMVSHAPLLAKISVERSFIEFDKLLLAKAWTKGLKQLLKACAHHYLPGLEQAKEACLLMIDQLGPDFCFQNDVQAWGALILYLKIAEPRTFLKAWKTSNEFQNAVLQMVALYQLRTKRALSKADLYHYGKEIAQLVENLRHAQGLSTDFRAIDQLYQALTIYDKHAIVIKGGDLIQTFGIQPGPKLGHILKQIEEKIVDGDLANTKEAILNFVKKELANE